jgi:hypothetical protein
MFAWLKTIATAGNKLARNLAALADTCEEINTGLREQVGLDKPARIARKVKAEVLDHKPVEADTDAA